ncbi:MAG: type I pullulanase [Ruminococcus sp.]|nr:type I pullulanase [Ruminococcus sp.]
MNKEKVKKFLCCAVAAVIMITPLCGTQAFAEEDYDDFYGVDDDGSLYGEALDGEEGNSDTDEISDSDTDKEENASEENSVSSVAELDKLAYNGDDLGAAYTKGATTFKVWSPTAERVQVLIYATGSDEEEDSKYISANEMTYDDKTGVWSATVTGDLLNKYYTYNVYTGKKGKETVDIYAKAVGVNGNRGMIVDLASTNPTDWDKDKHVSVDNQSEAVVWEVNVKDFSNDPASGISAKNRGKYLAFTENNTTVNASGTSTTGVAYLKELGVNYVQLLPIFDFGSVDEASKEDQFNWGYDPKNYNVPEGSYSSNPYDGNVRINEVKQMVQAIHNNNMGVVMDVVFNHTYEGAKSWFNITVPDYYYRFTDSGTWSNGSGCGNDTASEHLMFRKYMVDSVVYWAKEYHIDGFRFDLMGLHDVETMNAIRAALDELEGGEKILMYGEGWSLGTNAEPGTVMATQQNMKKLSDRIGAFNDGIRDGIKGSNFNASEGGYIQGGQGQASVKSGITAEVGNWANFPTQTVTYNSCHDNYTLWDKLVATSGSIDDYKLRDEKLVSMNKLAAAITLTSQGISFFQAGEEFARTKRGDENSYRSSSKINQLDWERRNNYSDLVQYYAGLIEIRKNFAPFTDPTETSVKNIKFIENLPKGVIAYTLKNDLKDKNQWKQVAVMFNATAENVEVELPEGLANDWVVVVNGDSAGLGGLSVVNGNKAVVKSGTALMLVDKESFDSAKLKSDKGTVTVKHVDLDSGNVIKKQVISGTIGNKYSVKADDSLAMEYTYKNSEGSVTGKYTAEGTEVTLNYTKYTGTFGTATIKFVDSETGKELTDAITQTGRTGDRYYTAEIPTIKGYALDLTNLPTNGAGKFTEGNTEIVYKYTPIQNEAVTVHYYNSNGWENLTLYAYGNGTQNAGETKAIVGEWPGAAMKNDGDGWWSYTIPSADLVGVSGVRVIFANGNAQDPLAGNEGFLVSGEVWINNGVIADKNDKEVVSSGKVNVIYIDYSGAVIDKDVYKGEIGKSYDIAPKDFFGYELVDNADNVVGNYTAEEINVIFNYQPNYGKSLIVWLAAGGVAVLAGGIAAFVLRKRKTV